MIIIDSFVNKQHHSSNSMHRLVSYPSRIIGILLLLSATPKIATAQHAYETDFLLAFAFDYRANGLDTTQSETSCSTPEIVDYLNCGRTSAERRCDEVSDIAYGSCPEDGLITTCNNPIITYPYVLYPYVEATKVKLYWSGNAGNYEVRWRPVDTSTWNNFTTVSNTMATLTGLQPDLTYEWQIRAACPNSNALVWVSGANFTTFCYTAANLTETSISPTSLNVRWLALSDILYILKTQ